MFVDLHEYLFNVDQIVSVEYIQCDGSNNYDIIIHTICKRFNVRYVSDSEMNIFCAKLRAKK